MVYDVVLHSVGGGLWLVELDGVVYPRLVSSESEFFELFGELVFNV